MYLARLNSDLTIDQTFTPRRRQWLYFRAHGHPPSPPTSGTTATATATIGSDDGRVNGFTLTSAGHGYTVAPTVTLSGGGGTGATATATLISGVVTAIKSQFQCCRAPAAPCWRQRFKATAKIMIGGNFYFYNGTTGESRRRA